MAYYIHSFVVFTYLTLLMDLKEVVPVEFKTAQDPLTFSDRHLKAT